LPRICLKWPLHGVDGEEDGELIGPAVAALFSALPALLAQHPAIKFQLEAEQACDGGNSPYLSALTELLVQPSVAPALVDLKVNCFEAQHHVSTAFLAPLSAATRLTSLKLVFLDLPNWPSALADCSALKELELESTRVVREEAPDFSRLRALTSLTIFESGLDDLGALRGLTGLRELCLADFMQPADEGAEFEDVHVFNLSPLTRLTLLYVSGFKSGALSRLGPLPPSLVQLDVSSTIEAADPRYRHYDAGWGPLPALTSLQLSYCPSVYPHVNTEQVWFLH
jgi:hypothetical protein